MEEREETIHTNGMMPSIMLLVGGVVAGLASANDGTILSLSIIIIKGTTTRRLRLHQTKRTTATKDNDKATKASYHKIHHEPGG